MRLPRVGGQRWCWNNELRMDQTDAAVWHEVCQLLEDPQRLEQAYRQQLASAASQAHPEGPAGLDTQLGKLRRGIARLIDSYAEGLIEKPEFEPRVTRLRERLQHLEAQRQQLMEAAAVEDELRLMLGHLKTFAATVKAGVHQADFPQRRDSIRTLVKRVDVDQHHLPVVFRVSPTALPPGSHDAPHTLQHCGGRELSGAFQAHGGATARCQPVREAQAFTRAGATRLRFDHARSLPVARQAADHHRPFVHVDACAPLKDALHGGLPRRLHGGRRMLRPPVTLRVPAARAAAASSSREAARTSLVSSISPTRSPLQARIRAPVRQQLPVPGDVRALLFSRLDAPSHLPTSARLPLLPAYRIFIPAGERSSCLLFRRT